MLLHPSWEVGLVERNALLFHFEEETGQNNEGAVCSRSDQYGVNTAYMVRARTAGTARQQAGCEWKATHSDRDS